ncbi:MAG: uracil-DNA glycosylase family protein [Thermoguttaceae bacterium]
MLESLRKEILRNSDNCVFPNHGNVEGFMGTAEITFVGERPSTGTFPTPADRLLYGLLEEFGVADAHLTDLVKTRGRVRDAYPDNEDPHCRWFQREIEILRPCMVVAFGRRAFDVVQFLVGSSIDIHQVLHYSHANRFPEKREQFISEMKDICQRFMERSKIKNEKRNQLRH